MKSSKKKHPRRVDEENKLRHRLEANRIPVRLETTTLERIASRDSSWKDHSSRKR